MFRNKSKLSREISPSVTVYKGPVLDKRAAKADDLSTVVVSYTEFISSSAGAKITSVFSDDLTGFTDIASFAAIYDEYRVLGLRLEYFPCNRYSKTTTLCRPLISVVDRDDAAVLSTYSSAVAYGSCRKESLEDPFVREIKMSGPGDATFLDTASFANGKNFIKLYADGLSASVEYGMVVLYARVQFRGKH
jgi:hypothetical protein